MTNKEFKLIRVKLGLTQAELAKELDLSANTISTHEKNDMDTPKLIELAMLMLERRYDDEQAANKE